MIAKIERLPLRDVWKHEAYDFTTWLQENVDVLNDVLELNLVAAEREQSAGTFNVDIVAEDESGNPIVIENQLEKSDHDHLGKLITYLVAIGARAAIWIVANPRPEHLNAITWLNESSSADFYLVKVEAIRIGNSPPAPLLTLIVGPSAEGKEIGETKKEFSERHQIRYRFWEKLLSRAKARTQLHSNISPGWGSWISTGAGKTGVSLNYVILQHEARVELYIDRGKDQDSVNKEMFDFLASEKDSIEESFGSPLDWQRLEGKRACRIAKRLNIGGYRDEEKWDEIQDQMIDAMIRFEEALRSRLKKLAI